MKYSKYELVITKFEKVIKVFEKNTNNALLSVRLE